MAYEEILTKNDVVELQENIDALIYNYESGSGTSVSITDASISQFKSIIITANTDMPNNGNRDNPVTLGYSSGISVTYPDGTTDGFEPNSKLYAIKGPWSADFSCNKRDWARKKDINRVFHYVFTGDEVFYDSSNTASHVFSLPIAAMEDFPVPYNTTTKCLIRCSHYIGTTYQDMYNLRNADDSSAVEGMVSVYGRWDTATLDIQQKNILFCDSRFSSRDEFKEYLKQQFYAGTPVEIAYITGFEYETDIPDADYQLYKSFELRAGNCTVSNQDGCGLECEWWKNFPVKNYIDWADSIKSYDGNNFGQSTYVTPEMYGAVGDGIVDDTAAIQSALDSGGLVYCGKNYKFTSLTMNKEGTSLYAVGSFISTSDANALKISASNCRVRINTLKCTNGILFDGNYVNRNRVYDTNIIFYGQYGIKLDADVAKITNCEFDSVKCSSANSGVGYGFWLNNEYSDGIYSYCNQHMFWNCQAYNCEIGALLRTRETYTDVVPVGDRMNCISFEKFNPEGCNLGIQLENFVNRCTFTDIRNNEFTGASSGWKPLIKLIGVSRGNTFSTTGHARQDMIIGEKYQYCEYNKTYVNSNSSTYTNVFRGKMMSMSSGRVFDETNFVLIPDLKGGLLWRNANPPTRGIKYIPSVGNDGLDEYMTFNASTTYDSMNIQASVFETKSSVSESPRLHLSREVTWDIHILVDPALPPIVVYDPYENIIFDVRNKLPSCKTMYTVHCDPDCSEKYYVTKEPLYSEDADYVTTAERTAWNNKLDSFTETDPTVPAWAKASKKPTYTASEVGAVPTSRTVNGKALSSNITLSASDVKATPASHATNKIVHITSNEREVWNESILLKKNTIEHPSNSSCFITYGGDKFVAIAQSNNNIAAYSTDGINWVNTSLIYDYNDRWNSLIYGAGKFIAFSQNQIINYSTDGINWVQQLCQQEFYNCRVIAYANVFLAVTGSGTTFISPDGINWDKMPNIANYPIKSITGHNGLFIGICDHTNLVAFGGINSWDYFPLPSDSCVWTSITYGNNKFVVVSNSNIAAYSTNGTDWIQTELPSSAGWDVVTYGNGKFITIARDVAAYSTDGINWTQTTLPTSDYWNSVTYGNGKFVAIGSSKVIYSTDGINWIYVLSENLQSTSGDDITESIKNLVKITPYCVAITLPLSSWDSTTKTQTVTVTGVLADEAAQFIQPTPALASQTAYYEAGILCTGQAENSLTFTCKNVPAEDLTVYVVIQEV